MNSERMAVRALCHLVAERIGLTFPESRRVEFREVLAEAMHSLGLHSLEALYGWLEDHPETGGAWGQLRERLTVGETYFFRDPAQLGVLREQLLRPLALEGKASRPRLWSAGCATGEEVYTLAILAREAGLDHADLLGTDLNPAAIRRAEAATYQEWSFRGVDPALRAPWFQKTRTGWTAQPELRAMVRFKLHNLAADPFEPLAEGEGFDLILCRNVLIYFEETTRRELIDRFLKALKPTGALVTGHNEITPGEARQLRVEHLTDSLVIRPGPREVPPLVTRVAAPSPLRMVRRPRPIQNPVPPNPLEGARQAMAGGEHARALELARGGRGADSIQVTALAMANLGQGEQALALVEDGLRRHPMDARLHYLHSLLACELGRDGESLRALDRTLYLAPDHVAAHMDRARIFATQGRLREALKDLEQALASLSGLDPASTIEGLEAHSVQEVHARCTELAQQHRKQAAG